MVWIGQTNHPLYSAVMLARTINDLCGGTVVTPWTVGDLPDEWLDAFTELQAVINQKRKA